MSRICALLLNLALRFQSFIVNVQAERPSRVRQIRDAFGKTPGAEPARMAFFYVILAVVGIIAFFTIRRLLAKAIAKSEADTLFAELCKAHDLSRHERELLRELAAQFEIDMLPALFVQKCIFEEALAQHNPPEREKRLQTLQAKLFA